MSRSYRPGVTPNLLHATTPPPTRPRAPHTANLRDQLEQVRPDVLVHVAGMKGEVQVWQSDRDTEADRASPARWSGAATDHRAGNQQMGDGGVIAQVTDDNTVPLRTTVG